MGGMGVCQNCGHFWPQKIRAHIRMGPKKRLYFKNTSHT